MTAADRERFCQIVLGLAEVYSTQLSSPALTLYWNCLKAWSLDDFRAAAELLLRRCQFMPRPADFEALRRAAQPLAGEAWVRVLAHLRGGYRSGAGVDDGGPIDQAVRSLGGYHSLAFRDTQFLGIDERRFVERFAQIVEAVEVRRALPRLANPMLAAGAETRQLPNNALTVAQQS
jgi:hypothetical protein